MAKHGGVSANISHDWCKNTEFAPADTGATDVLCCGGGVPAMVLSACLGLLFSFAAALLGCRTDVAVTSSNISSFTGVDNDCAPAGCDAGAEASQCTTNSCAPIRIRSPAATPYHLNGINALNVADGDADDDEPKAEEGRAR
eukprot:PhM_4_TR4868/c0_g2_i1/m.66451